MLFGHFKYQGPDGQTYNSLSEMCRELGLSYYRVYTALNKGENLATVIERELAKNKTDVVANNETEKLIKAAVHKTMTLSKDKEYSNSIFLDAYGKLFMSYDDMCSFHKGLNNERTFNELREHGFGIMAAMFINNAVIDVMKQHNIEIVSIGERTIACKYDDGQLDEMEYKYFKQKYDSFIALDKEDALLREIKSSIEVIIKESEQKDKEIARLKSSVADYRDKIELLERQLESLNNKYIQAITSSNFENVPAEEKSVQAEEKSDTAEEKSVQAEEKSVQTEKGCVLELTIRELNEKLALAKKAGVKRENVSSLKWPNGKEYKNYTEVIRDFKFAVGEKKFNLNRSIGMSVAAAMFVDGRQMSIMRNAYGVELQCIKKDSIVLVKDNKAKKIDLGHFAEWMYSICSDNELLAAGRIAW